TLKWIANLKSPTLLLRMKSLLFKMEQSGQTPPNRILSVVVERNNEIKYGKQRHVNSEISRILDTDKKNKEKDKLQKQLAELSAKLDKLEQDNAKKDEELNLSASAIQDLLKMVNDLKSTSVEKQESKKNTSTKTTSSKTQKAK